MRVLPNTGRESEKIFVIAGVPEALHKYFVTAHSEAQHTAFDTTSLQLHSSKPLFLVQEGAGTLSRALAAAVPHVDFTPHGLCSLT